MKIKYVGLSHINIVVDDLEKATAFYQQALAAVTVQSFPHFRNRGFSLSAGFIDSADSVDVSIRFLQIPTPQPIVIELMEYHSPSSDDHRTVKKPHDINNVGHIALSVSNIDEVFSYLSEVPGVKMINTDPEYRPYKIDDIQPQEFYFHDAKSEEDHQEKIAVCKVVSNIRYFYWVDPYGVQWEIEQGHTGLT